MAKKFCIVHESVGHGNCDCRQCNGAANCDCPPEVANAKEYIQTFETMSVPPLVQLGGLPDGIKADDRGPFIATWRRTYSKAYGGSWHNKMISFERKEPNSELELEVAMLLQKLSVELVDFWLQGKRPEMDRMRRAIMIEDALNYLGWSCGPDSRNRAMVR
jgi:hypothetical protein